MRHPESADSEAVGGERPPEERSPIRCALRESQDVLRKVRDESGPDNQRMVATTLAHLDFCLGTNAGRPRLGRQAGSEKIADSTRRFLGHASDVSFFNSVRQLIRSNREHQDVFPHLESYERDGADPDLLGGERLLVLPDQHVSDKFVDVYFGTIHIAYPFVCRQQFLQDYRSFWEQSAYTHPDISFRPLLCTFLATHYIYFAYLN